MRLLVVALGAYAVVTLYGCACTDAGCNDGVTVHGEIGVAVTERVHLDIRACRNGVCSHGVLDADPPGGSSGGNGSIRLEGDAEVWCNAFAQQNQEWWSFGCEFAPDDGAGSFEDGDRIELRVIDLDTGDVEVELSKPVNYTESAPNGEWCGPVCDGAGIELDPP
jgi:hypothetical protein